MFFVSLFSTYANETKTTIWNDFVSKVSFGGNVAYAAGLMQKTVSCSSMNLLK